MGISADPVKNQKKFHDKFGFKYDLLADETMKFVKNSGWATQKFMGKEFMGIVRTTFLFDENLFAQKSSKSRNQKSRSSDFEVIFFCIVILNETQ